MSRKSNASKWLAIVHTIYIVLWSSAETADI